MVDTMLGSIPKIKKVLNFGMGQKLGVINHAPTKNYDFLLSFLPLLGIIMCFLNFETERLWWLAWCCGLRWRWRHEAKPKGCGGWRGVRSAEDGGVTYENGVSSS